MQWYVTHRLITSNRQKLTFLQSYMQRNMLKTLMNSYEQIRSFANKNEVRVNEFIKLRKNEVTSSFLVHENEFVIPNSW